MMWVLGADADEAAGQASLETISGLVSQHGGQLAAAEAWGRRTLSYPIKKNKEGSYFLAHFTMEQARVPEFERALNLNQDIIRYLVVIPDTKQPKKREGKHAGRSEAATPAASS